MLCVEAAEVKIRFAAGNELSDGEKEEEIEGFSGDKEFK